MSKQKRTQKGCWYWIFIGWVSETFRWIFICICVHFFGIVSPESSSPITTNATSFMAPLVRGETVILIKDFSGANRYDRLLRHFFVGDKFGIVEIGRSRFATAGTWKADIACDSTFYTAMASAKMKQFGVWGPFANPIPATALTITSYMLATVLPIAGIRTNTQAQSLGSNCDLSYPDFYIPPPPPDLNRKNVAPHKRFRVLPPDPHHFDSDVDGIGCES